MTEQQCAHLAELAWAVRENSHLLGKTAVGAAVLTCQGAIFAGCNVEHVFRSHDVHAEVNAIGSMVAAGQKHLAAIFVAAERERFTPCGACMDWIMQFGGNDCIVAWQSSRDGEIQVFRARELMPFYPF
jgi:cytidine deaminase